jgi:hypothetical protein
MASRAVLGAAMRDLLLSAAAMLAFVLCAGLASLVLAAQGGPAWQAMVVMPLMAPIAIVAKYTLTHLYARGYGAPASPVAA